MKTHSITALCLFFLLTGSLVAQSNFKEGYLISLQKDTLKGFIDLRIDEQNAQVCTYKETEKSEHKLYYPADIAGYIFVNEGKYYVSHSIEINGQSRQVFLEYLVQGLMNLYFYEESETKTPYYFFEDESGKIRHVTKKPDEVVNSYIQQDTRYQGMLNFIFQDYPSLTSTKKEIPFERSSMIKLVKSYHEQVCTTGEQCVVFENDYKQSFTSFRFSPYVGVQFWNLKHKGDQSKLGSIDATSPIIGVEVSISEARRSELFSALLDFSFAKVDAEKKVGLRYSDTGNLYSWSYKLKAMMWNSKFGARYTFGGSKKAKLKSSIDGGVAISYMFNIKETFEIKDQYEKGDALPTWGMYGGARLDYFLSDKTSAFARVTGEWGKNVHVTTILQLKVGVSF